MTLPEQIRLVNDLIKENPEATVRDYVETLAEIEWIGQTSEQRSNIKDIARMGLIYKRRKQAI